MYVTFHHSHWPVSILVIKHMVKKQSYYSFIKTFYVTYLMIFEKQFVNTVM